MLSGTTAWRGLSVCACFHSSTMRWLAGLWREFGGGGILNPTMPQTCQARRVLSDGGQGSVRAVLVLPLLLPEHFFSSAAPPCRHHSLRMYSLSFSSILVSHGFHAAFLTSRFENLSLLDRLLRNQYFAMLSPPSFSQIRRCSTA